MSDSTESLSTFNWLTGVIESCKHSFHLECVDRLIELYYEKHKDESLRDCLILKRLERWEIIHAIII